MLSCEEANANAASMRARSFSAWLPAHSSPLLALRCVGLVAWVRFTGDVGPLGVRAMAACCCRWWPVSGLGGLDPSVMCDHPPRGWAAEPMSYECW